MNFLPGLTKYLSPKLKKRVKQAGSVVQGVTLPHAFQSVAARQTILGKIQSNKAAELGVKGAVLYASGGLPAIVGAAGKLYADRQVSRASDAAANLDASTSADLAVKDAEAARLTKERLSITNNNAPLAPMPVIIAGFAGLAAILFIALRRK